MTWNLDAQLEAEAARQHEALGSSNSYLLKIFNDLFRSLANISSINVLPTTQLKINY
jgi:hypothetical protein